MSPPLTSALMQGRPLLDPLPSTIVPTLLLSNPLYHKCRISDHLHLAFQWGIHTSHFTKRDVAQFTNVYTPPALARSMRKHEGHPARAPDGTIMEIAGDACPGNTGETVGPWDLENVHLCEGFSEWSAGLLRTLKVAFAAGLTIQDVNMPKPSRVDLDRANNVDGQWLHGKPLHPSTRNRLLVHRDAIRDKLNAFLLFVDGQIKSDSGKEAVLRTLRKALDAALSGKEVGEYNGVLGGMVNKIVDRIEEFIRYMEEKIEVKEAREQRIDEVREIVDGALREKWKRKRDDDEEESDKERKKVLTEDIRQATEQTLTQELALGPATSKAERKRKRESNKTKEKDLASEKSKSNDKPASGDRISTEEEVTSGALGLEKTEVEKSYSCDESTEKADSESASETSTAKAKEAEAYSSRCLSPSAPATPSPPGFQRPESPPPPYSEHVTPSTNIKSDAPSPAFTTPQSTSASSPPSQTSEEYSPSSPQSPKTSHGPLEQPVGNSPMTSAARVLDQILNPGKHKGRASAEESISRPSSSSVRTEASANTDREVSAQEQDVSPHLQDEEELVQTTPNQVPEVSSTYTPSSESSSQPPSPILQQIINPAPQEEQQDEDEEVDESSLFLPQTPPPPPPPRQREASSDSDSELPPPKYRPGSSKQPIDIDSDQDEPLRPTFKLSNTKSSRRPSKDIIEIKGEDYIEIKDEDDDVKPFKPFKPFKPVKIEDEIMMCSEDVWMREVETKNRRGLRRGR
ncbi:hypothetical protein BKA61DRAFT_679485 [Leptodontidium sp. MPI-SDFR-AT-0119]|nr:hypothetical protein BKA61DRAFT_679485 [Leptodontidium sp. MPI-SDFR-AT-0119]